MPVEAKTAIYHKIIWILKNPLKDIFLNYKILKIWKMKISSSRPEDPLNWRRLLTDSLLALAWPWYSNVFICLYYHKKKTIFSLCKALKFIIPNFKSLEKFYYFFRLLIASYFSCALCETIMIWPDILILPTFFYYPHFCIFYFWPLGM